MIGDTPEVDILGAMNAGIDQIYVNHINNPEHGECHLYCEFAKRTGIDILMIVNGATFRSIFRPSKFLG